MDLIHLIEKLVANPEELAAFKADREAYLARRHPSLLPQLRALLLQHNFLETGTVMSITSRELRYRDNGDRPAQAPPVVQPPKRINLKNTQVILRTRVPFFAEHLANAPDRWPGYVCTLMEHSFAHAVQYGSQWVVHFTLNLSFVDPRNKSDQPQMLTLQSGDPNYEPAHYNLGNTSVYLHITPHQYILLRGAHDFCVYLGKHSYYDTETEEIHLCFDDPEIPPP